MEASSDVLGGNVVCPSDGKIRQVGNCRHHCKYYVGEEDDEDMHTLVCGGK